MTPSTSENSGGEGFASTTPEEVSNSGVESSVERDPEETGGPQSYADIDAARASVKAYTKMCRATRRLKAPCKNADGMFACLLPATDCGKEVRDFTSRSEWRKHMDQHHRPYPCIAKVCEAPLQGFTYPGGAVRHMREVHRMYGGPSGGCCPFGNCKRSKVVFTRKENLNEHIRRLHSVVADEPATDEHTAEAPVPKPKDPVFANKSARAIGAAIPPLRPICPRPVDNQRPVLTGVKRRRPGSGDDPDVAGQDDDNHSLAHHRPRSPKKRHRNPSASNSGGGIAVHDSRRRRRLPKRCPGGSSGPTQQATQQPPRHETPPGDLMAMQADQVRARLEEYHRKLRRSMEKERSRRSSSFPSSLSGLSDPTGARPGLDEAPVRSRWARTALPSPPESV